MSEFWKNLFGLSQREIDRINDIGGPVRGEPSETATKLAKAIEASGANWAFEDDQGHSHCYDLGITVSHGPKAIVWQGMRDLHVGATYGEHTKLFEAAARTPDAAIILGALKARRTRHEKDVAAAETKRVMEAIEKLSRGECLEDPLRSNAIGALTDCSAALMRRSAYDYYRPRNYY